MAACIEDPKTIIDPPPYPKGGSLPPGGTTGQVLTKASDADGDAVWANGGGGSPVVVDPTLSTTSTNPVQNKVITIALNDKASASDVTNLTTVVNDKADKSELDGKVDKVAGMGLSANSFTDAEKTKLSNIEEYTTVPLSEVESWFV